MGASGITPTTSGVSASGMMSGMSSPPLPADLTEAIVARVGCFISDVGEGMDISTGGPSLVGVSEEPKVRIDDVVDVAVAVREAASCADVSGDVVSEVASWAVGGEAVTEGEEAAGGAVVAPTVLEEKMVARANFLRRSSAAALATGPGSRTDGEFGPPQFRYRALQGR